MKIRELFVPVAIVAMIVGMMLPLPVLLLDILLVINLLLATALLLSALSISDPIKLSALPTMLLLATLYRLTLNISTTRLILTGGEAGQVVAAFGSVVIGGSLAVGVVIFLIITLIQFVVIAKGAERIAEVAARFTLDALPGKQMAVDADVRSGLLDVERAREKREELQVESRFYGALDGAMKFVKGDAIAGLIIVLINIVGGICIGLLIEQAGLLFTLRKYVSLTVGDGLVSQIPALLNSLTAGIVVTKVARGEDSSVAQELFGQLFQGRMIRSTICFVCLLLGCLPGMPAVPFVIIGAGLLLVRPGKPGMPSVVPEAPIFQPKAAPLLAIAARSGLVSRLSLSTALALQLDGFRQRMFQQFGFLLPRIEFSTLSDEHDDIELVFRGTSVGRIESGIAEELLNQQISAKLTVLVEEFRTEFIDDVHTRRLLDFFESSAPDLITSVVPATVSVTQLTVILRNLVREKISIRNFDLIAQAVAEAAPRLTSERQFTEEVRIALGRTICAPYVRHDQVLRAVSLDPLIDMAFTEAERGVRLVESSLISRLFEFLSGIEPEFPLIVARGSRALLADCMRARGLERQVLAYEEVPRGIKLELLRTLHLLPDELEQVAGIAGVVHEQ